MRIAQIPNEGEEEVCGAEIVFVCCQGSSSSCHHLNGATHARGNGRCEIGVRDEVNAPVPKWQGNLKPIPKQFFNETIPAQQFHSLGVAYARERIHPGTLPATPVSGNPRGVPGGNRTHIIGLGNLCQSGSSDSPRVLRTSNKHTENRFDAPLWVAHLSPSLSDFDHLFGNRLATRLAVFGYSLQFRLVNRLSTLMRAANPTVAISGCHE